MYDITAVEYTATRAIASLTVHEPGADKLATIVSRDVSLFKISNSPGDMEIPTVADVFFAEWSGSMAFEKLREEGWGYKALQPAETIYLCHVEGGLVLDILYCQPFSFEESAYCGN